MKYADKHKMIGSLQGDTFKIAANAKSFDALVGSVYTKPIQAVIRELSTNAVDAHKQAGHNEPIQVTIPLKSRDKFVVRDYGNGLSEEDVRDIYTVMFCSTKDDSNEYNGVWGIGSKSPFAIVDSFTVTSIYQGVKYSYVLFKNDKGEPSYKLVHTEPTTERSGIEITILPPSNSIYSWKSEAERVYRWFEVAPKINIDIPKNEYSYFKDNLGILKDGIYHYGMVVMANVAYEAQSLPANYILFVPNGEVEFNLGRESIYDSTKNRNKIQQLLDVETKKIANEISLQIKTFSTEVEQYRYAYDVVNKVHGLNIRTAHLNLSNGSYTYRLYYHGHNIVDFPNVYELNASRPTYKRYYSDRVSSDKYASYLNRVIRHDYDITFLKNPKDKTDHRRIKHWVETNKKGCVVLIPENDIVKIGEAAGLKFIDVTTLPDPPKIVRGKKTTTTTECVICFSHNKSEVSVLEWLKNRNVKQTDYRYVECTGWTVHCDGKEYDSELFLNKLHELNTKRTVNGEKPLIVFGFRKNVQGYFKSEKIKILVDKLDNLDYEINDEAKEKIALATFLEARYKYANPYNNLDILHKEFPKIFSDFQTKTQSSKNLKSYRYLVSDDEITKYHKSFSQLEPVKVLDVIGNFNMTLVPKTLLRCMIIGMKQEFKL